MTTTATRTTLFSRGLALPTIGMVAIVAVAAFQNLAMTTIMPEISRDLHGETLYSLSFAAPLAAGVPGMVLAGNWTDRAGGRVVAWVSASLFAIGTAIVMLAPTMPVFLAGRLVEGFGAGAIDVVLYVLVARIFPEDLHGLVFAGFAAAWVVPALVGPALAGIVTDLFSWHWVFAGALVIAVAAFALLVPTLGRLQAPAVALRPPWQRGRIAWSAGAAVAVLLLNVAPDLPVALRIAAVVVGLGGAWFALRPLLPRRTLTAAPGLPSVVLLRGVLAAGFFGSEAYVPFLLQAQHGLSPSAAGLALTVAALSWAGASWVHGRMGERRLTAARAFAVGLGLVLVSLVAALAVALADLPVWVLVAGWFVGGAGMGIAYPRTSMLTLRFSTEGDDGFASSALTIADAAGSVVGLAVAGLLFTGLGGRSDPMAFAAVFAAMIVIALVGLLAVVRLGHVPPPTSDPAAPAGDQAAPASDPAAPASDRAAPASDQATQTG
ncbi:MFS transporter [Curtobacterium sp. VKM Ac-2922]|uniref:MFS transporter n=1 Tax=Curtobacterium sp. VKM Ac-2922 TaxID=2929475 RepID=UPI001FB3E811|nr:MFS transporter [Curtobacterium sp. VKM Ac-2922]MCJ1713487.1 MFS transporter [Curtobacterium sp. VKM Ac-2922]